ncbi:MAG: hypothetical protein NHG36_16750 [Chromatiaceae bacterium]|nr:hypothetical protein [Candidatus Thioaporhodococcus sediminis]
MKGLIPLLLVLLGGVGFFLYKNPRDKRDLQKILRDTQAGPTTIGLRMSGYQLGLGTWDAAGILIGSDARQPL